MNDRHKEDDLLARAARLFIYADIVSEALLRQHFRIDEEASGALMHQLEAIRIVTQPSATGMRTLTEKALLMQTLTSAPKDQDQHTTAWANPFLEAHGHAGNPQAPAVWWWHAFSPDTSNWRAENLIAIINGELPEQAGLGSKAFSDASNLYFSGCLFPLSAAQYAILGKGRSHAASGIDREEFLAWCRTHRFPRIAALQCECRPKLVIGSGAIPQEFASALFGSELPMTSYGFAVNGFFKKVFYTKKDGVCFVVLPKLPAGGSSDSDPTFIHLVGTFIAGLIR